MNQFQHFVNRKQDVLIGSYVAKMSSDFYLCPQDIWRPVIGRFSSGHSQAIDNSSLKRFPSCINSTNILKSLFVIHRLMGFTMQCLLCGRRSPSSGQFFLNFCRRIAPSVVNVFVRGMVLFILGAFFAMVLFMFSVLPEARRKRIQAVDLGIIANLFSAVWWIAPSSGTAAALVGIMYPCTDIRLGKPHKLEREWSSVFKCLVFFLGISHACAKISFNSPTHFSLFMAIASLILWWLFDRSKNGLGLAVLVTFCACALLQSLIYLGVYRNGEPDFLYARKWIPWFFFSGVVTFGTIGRQLAMIEYNFGRSKEHVD